MSLGHPPYLQPKGMGGQEHVGKARTNQNRLDGALQDPHDMVKARLPES